MLRVPVRLDILCEHVGSLGASGVYHCSVIHHRLRIVVFVHSDHFIAVVFPDLEAAVVDAYGALHIHRAELRCFRR